MPKIITAVPGGITEVEKRAIVNAISSYGVRSVYLIETPKASAMGAGLDILSGEGKLVADLGGGTADIAVISLGGVSAGISIKKAGNEMDKNIIKYMKMALSADFGDVFSIMISSIFLPFLPLLPILIYPNRLPYLQS